VKKDIKNVAKLLLENDNNLIKRCTAFVKSGYIGKKNIRRRPVFKTTQRNEPGRYDQTHIKIDKCAHEIYKKAKFYLSYLKDTEIDIKQKLYQEIVNQCYKNKSIQVRPIVNNKFNERSKTYHIESGKLRHPGWKR